MILGNCRFWGMVLKVHKVSERVILGYFGVKAPFEGLYTVVTGYIIVVTWCTGGQNRSFWRSFRAKIGHF